MASLAASGTATAAFPNFSDCPTASGSIYCINVASTSGSMTIKGFTVPIHDSLEIRGGLASPDGSSVVFQAPRGTSGVFARPIQVPGGLLGIDFPIPGNAVTATAKLAGPPSALRVDLNTFTLAMPMKLALTNPILGSGCQIGSDRNPANVVLTIRRIGHADFVDGALIFTGNTNGDSTFAIPGATGCGINLGLINSLVNLKLGLPSSSGNNDLTVNNNFALKSVG
ncbi:hypothetical protein [Conexibacter woesei]|uniref:hypothetical protein n=1 Tax=Conexibacter woesei TaxID=191495 RepID=UPI0002E166A5|nr:hypothetical protein [Conexibacter woesei]